MSNAEVAKLDVPALKMLAETAGREIMKIYALKDSAVMIKTDHSPLTEADLRANTVIMDGLRKLSPYPIISEEIALHEEIGETFWLVDPLDGTRDFVAHLDTFVVCLALVHKNRPIFGLIHQPVTNQTWWAEKNRGAFGQGDEPIANGSTRERLLVAGSRSQPSERMKAFYERFNVETIDRFGSALKFCKVAEGSYDLYPRFGPTYEWDTAAGQVILEEAGCKLIDVKTGQPMTYAKPGFLNGGFIASRKDLEFVSRLAGL